MRRGRRWRWIGRFPPGYAARTNAERLRFEHSEALEQSGARRCACLGPLAVRRHRGSRLGDSQHQSDRTKPRSLLPLQVHQDRCHFEPAARCYAGNTRKGFNCSGRAHISVERREAGQPWHQRILSARGEPSRSVRDAGYRPQLGGIHGDSPDGAWLTTARPLAYAPTLKEANSRFAGLAFGRRLNSGPASRSFRTV